MINLHEYLSLSEGNTVSGRLSFDWTKSFQGIKIPHQKQDCSVVMMEKIVVIVLKNLKRVVLIVKWRELLRRVWI